MKNLSLFLVLLLSAPMLALVFVALFFPNDLSDLKHLISTNLWTYVSNSFVLASLVSIGALLVGTGLAWCCTAYQFPGKSFWQWALVTPLVFTPYIVAYTYAGIFDYGGEGHRILKEYFGWEIAVHIRSLKGAVFVFIFSLYPYVYIIARATLYLQSQNTLMAARSLGLNGRRTFLRLILPTLRPAAVSGVALVAMETLSDYAAAMYLGVATLSVGIWRTWFGIGVLSLTAQLSMLLLIFTIFLALLEKISRKGAHFNDDTPASPTKPQNYFELSVPASWAITVLCAIPVLIGFLLPTVQLLAWSSSSAAELSFDRYGEMLSNTLILAVFTAGSVTLLALLLAWSQKTYVSRFAQSLYTAAVHSYVLPGVVLAVGVVVAVTSLDRILDFVQQNIGWGKSPVFFSGTLAAVLFAYSVKFLAVGHNTIHSGLQKIPVNLERSARLTHSSPARKWQYIYIPYLYPALLASLVLVFVESVKELPMVLVLRPFDFTTFSIFVYEMAETEQLSRIGIPALSIAAIGFMPILLLSRSFFSLYDRSARTEPPPP